MASGGNKADEVIARLDRLSVWSLPYLFIGIIGTGFLFTFYDIFDINVSFIQTCAEVVKGCTPHVASQYLGIPVLLNLVGYVIGTLILSPVADRIGRRDMLLISMIVTGIGSLATAFADSYTLFNAARWLTGIGIGVDLAIVNTYINEVAPSRDRVRYTSLIFVFSALGALVGIWLGLILTTPAEPFPLGLPFAMASEEFVSGWRIMYAIGALLALVAILLRLKLPESPRWLVSQGRVDEAERVVADMEGIARQRGPLAEVTKTASVVLTTDRGLPYKHLLFNATYRKRVVVLFLMWFSGYITVYAYAAGFTSVLASLDYPPPEAGLIAAFGTLGFVGCAFFAYWFGDRLERGTWLLVSAVLTLVGGIVVASAGHFFVISVIGAVIIFFGFNLWVPVAYSWSTENFPTRARTSGFALVDGLGHLGGGVGILVLAPILPGLGVLQGLSLVSGFLFLAWLISLLGVKTRGRLLDEVSP